MAEVQPPDLTGRLRRPSERLALVEYIAGSPTLQENEHLEWKSGYNLGRRPDAGKVAKQLISFANRDPVRSQRLTGGYAYLLLGVEAGRVIGVPVWDSADIESWLSRFVPSELMYDVHYVTAEGKDVLVLEVDPPRQGDTIFCLQASTGDGGSNMAEGTIYVRRGGKTEMAGANEIAMLTARTASGATETELDLELVTAANELSALNPRLLMTSTCEHWMQQARAGLLNGIPSAQPLISPVGESRTPDEVRGQATRYLQEIATNWPDFALSRHVLENHPSLTLSVTNRTDENFENVVIEVDVPIPARSIGISAESVAEEFSVAKPPLKWGEYTTPKLNRNIFGASVEPEVSAVGEEMAKIRFPPVHIYPQTTHPLEPVTLALVPEWENSDLKIEWRATAANTRGLITGEVSIAIPGRTDTTVDQPAV
jgi:hypothetical protein